MSCHSTPFSPPPLPRPRPAPLPAQVRANSLQELVYKQGQAGITKATVSIVFDNRDKVRAHPRTCRP